MSSDEGRDRSVHTGILVAGTVVLVASAMILASGGGGGPAGDQGPDGPVFYTSSIDWIAFLPQWAVEAGVSYPSGVAVDDTAETTVMRELSTGGAVGGMVALSNAPRVTAANRNLTAVAAFHRPADMFSLYVRADSNITGMADIAGTRVAMTPLLAGDLARLALARAGVPDTAYNITPVGLERSRLLLRTGEVDAALLHRPPSEGDYRRIASPQAELEEAFGGWIAMNLIVSHRDHTGTSMAVADALNRTLISAAADPEAAMDSFRSWGGNDTAFLETGMHSRVYRLTNSSRERHQAVLDAMADRDILFDLPPLR